MNNWRSDLEESTLFARFEEQGFLSPIPLFSTEECKDVLDRTRKPAECGPVDWIKGWAAVSSSYADLGRRDDIIDIVKELIGENVVLWGASLVVRRPGMKHPWHTDIESSAVDGKTVSVWIGLQNTDGQTSLKLVPGSHRFGVTIQELLQRNEIVRDNVTDNEILTWSGERDNEAKIVTAESFDGDAVFFDGRLWHGSHNSTNKRTRIALLLQYASVNTPIYIPDDRRPTWPFTLHNYPRPRCLLVSGTDKTLVNKIVPAPSKYQYDMLPSINTCIRSLGKPLEGDPTKDWTSLHGFEGSTADLAYMSCGASVLKVGAIPHAPHKHREEEVLIVLDGCPELILQDEQPGKYKRVVAPSGTMSYYPAWYEHTLENTGDKPASYLMFKWIGDDSSERSNELQPQVLNFAEIKEGRMDDDFQARTVLDGSTKNLRKLHCHITNLRRGEGYDAHADSYDVGIILLEGEVETMGQRLKPFGIAYFAAGELHDMRNVGEGDALYLVFEFHGRHSTFRDSLQKPLSFWDRLVRLIKEPSRLKNAVLRRISR